jgi:hypothetical protein
MNCRFSLFCAVLIGASASAASSRVVPDIHIETKQEKLNAILNVEKAAAAGLIDKNTFDGLVGVTNDFNANAVPAYIVFDDSVPEKKLKELANFQGRIQGAVQCKRIRLGTSPMFPHVKLGVLAEQCSIKSLNH